MNYNSYSQSGLWEKKYFCWKTFVLFLLQIAHQLIALVATFDTENNIETNQTHETSILSRKSWETK